MFNLNQETDTEKSKASFTKPESKAISSSMAKNTAFNETIVITIDGPAASGKTTVSRELARRLGFSWVSTGAFYRGLALAAQKLKVDLSDEQAMAKLAGSAEWAVKMGPEGTHVFVQNMDVTSEVHQENTGTAASQISQYQGVRKALLPLQRACAEGVQGLIAEGRDCGTVVFPQASAKVFLTARSEDRAKRRAIQQGDSAESIEKIHLDQKQRDQRDSARKSAPLLTPDGALTLDTSDLSLVEVLDTLENWVKKQV